MPRSRQCFASSSVGMGLKVHPMIDCLMRAFLILKPGSSSAMARAAADGRAAATAAPLSRVRRFNFVILGSSLLLTIERDLLGFAQGCDKLSPKEQFHHADVRRRPRHPGPRQPA